MFRERVAAARIALVPLFGAVFVLAGGCSYDQDPRSPNIVIVLVDQLRPDAAERWMPEVRELASRGVVFDNMRAVAPWTYPSVISLFSGLYPQQHGADGHPQDGQILSTFDEALPLLPKLLQGRYYTAGFVTNPFLQRWNPFHRGFDHYAIDEFIGDQGNRRGYGREVWKKHMFSDSVNAAVFEHFDDHRQSEPEFVYVHYIDVHGPWMEAPFDVGPPVPLRATNERGYEAAARFVDGKIRDLYDYFSARYDENLLFVVTSDHGQELGDDLLIGEDQALRIRKATVHDFNTRIPFFLLPSSAVDGPRVVSVPCANIDVFPTLLDWIGVAPPSNLPGRSLLPAIRGPIETEDWQRPIYAKMSAFNHATDCIVVGTQKLMRHFDPVTGAEVSRVVFDLQADPRETHGLSPASGPDGALLERSADTHGILYPKRFQETDPETLERLQYLGYAGEAGSR